MSKPIIVANIKSFSYSGTTWLNLLLGSHPRAAALGPPNRVADMFSDPQADGHDACRVHGAACPFWPAFFRDADRNGNFYVQLAQHMDKDVIVLNNVAVQSRASADLVHRDIIEKPIAVVRDGRGVVSSYQGYFPEQDLLDIMTKWFCTFMDKVPYDPGDPDTLSLRYEDTAADLDRLATQAGTYLGLDYGSDFVRYWEFDHHLIGCNPGPLAILRRHLNLPLAKSVDSDATEKRYQNLCADPYAFKVEQRWEQTWGERDKLIFDYFAGFINAQWGYERDQFGLDTVQEFQAELLKSYPALVPDADAARHQKLTTNYHGRRAHLARLLTAFHPQNLRKFGLKLTPLQVKHLGLLAAGIGTIALVLAFALGAMLA